MPAFAGMTMILLLSLSACQKTPFTDGGPQAHVLFALKDPIVYARYQNLPNLLNTSNAPCLNAYRFRPPDTYHLNRIMDLCGPVPTLANPTALTPWKIPNRVKSIHWEQDLKPGENIRVDITDSEGIPIPAKSELSKKENRYFVELKSLKPLPIEEIMFVRAVLSDSNQKELAVWRVPLKVSRF
ncbi:MAG: hypothetical protein JKY15_00120 [Deltaproteobacteria bacterium]|nr:hypothetical protein [Deltaproteobacteria bacterium]